MKFLGKIELIYFLMSKISSNLYGSISLNLEWGLYPIMKENGSWFSLETFWELVKERNLKMEWNWVRRVFPFYIFLYWAPVAKTKLLSPFTPTTFTQWKIKMSMGESCQKRAISSPRSNQPYQCRYKPAM